MNKQVSAKSMNQIKTLSFLCLAALSFLSACTKELYEPPHIDTQSSGAVTAITSLRAEGSILGEEGLYFSVWDKNLDKEKLFTTAKKNGPLWQLKESCVITEPSLVVSVYPDILKNVDGSVLVQEADQKPVYYARLDLDQSSDRTLNLEFKQLQATLTFLFDFSSFPSSSRVDEIRFSPRYSYGWLDLHRGVFNRMNIPENERITIYRPINSSIQELTQNEKLYKQTILMMPQNNTEITVFVVIDGVEHYFSMKLEKVESNKEYVAVVDVFNSKEVVPLTPKEKNKGIDLPVPEIDDIFFTDYEYTATHQYMQDLSNNSGVVMNFWLDNRTDREENIEYRVLIRDEQENVVCQSPIYSGLSVKPYHYDGFSVPFFLSVPKVGRYRYQLLLRTNGGKWYEPDQKDDDIPENKYFNVHPEQCVFSSIIYLSANSGKIHSSTITTPRYNVPEISYWWLNNYSDKEQKVTIRLYNRRKPFENHSRLALDEMTTWEDKIGEGEYIIPPLTSHQVAIPYNITVRRPHVNRYLSYICATITYHTPNDKGLIVGKEYPLLQDGNLLYRKSYMLRNPSPFVGSSWVNNKIIIDPK